MVLGIDLRCFFSTFIYRFTDIHVRHMIWHDLILRNTLIRYDMTQSSWIKWHLKLPSVWFSTMSMWWNEPWNRDHNIHCAQCSWITSSFFISNTVQNSAECNVCHLAWTGASDIETSTVIIHSITAHRYKLEASHSIVESLESLKPPGGLVQK